MSAGCGEGSGGGEGGSGGEGEGGGRGEGDKEGGGGGGDGGGEGGGEDTGHCGQAPQPLQAQIPSTPVSNLLAQWFAHRAGVGTGTAVSPTHDPGT